MDTQNFPSYNFVDIITLFYNGNDGRVNSFSESAVYDNKNNNKKYFHLNVKRESGNDKFTIGRGKNNGNYSKEGLNVIVILKVSQSIVY